MQPNWPSTPSWASTFGLRAMSEVSTTVRAMDEPVENIRIAADQLDNTRFLELLRWHRVVAGLLDLDWTAPGAYRQGVSELPAARAAELLHDVRRAGRDPRSRRHGADGKPIYGAGRTLKDQYRNQ